MTDVNTNNDEKLQLNKNLDEADNVNAEVDLDDSKAKFINGGSKLDESGDVRVEIASSASEGSFNGLGKDELMKYATDPFWVRLRWVLFILFWVGWVAMLVAAIIIIVFAPRCPHRPALKWYNKEATYQVYTQSFKDSDGDGVGDIKGIESKLSYFEDLGIKALWLNSIFKSDNVDGGNGIIDYKMIDPRLGTMEDFTSLTKKMFQKEMRLIVDFIPNHTSKNHTWFQKSSKGETGYEDYYVWADNDNGWKDAYGKSAWEYDATRTKYYLHQTAKEFPDLNLRNPAVMKEMEEILRFWADKGVYGFNIVGAEYLTENANFTAQTGSSSSETINYPDNVEVIQQFRKVINSLSDKPGRERVLMANFPVRYDRNSTYQYFGESDGLLVVPSRLFAELDDTCDGNCLERQIKNEAGSIEQWRGWMLGDQNIGRAATRYKDDIRLIQVIQMLLPGTAYIYYGDEIGMQNGVYAANPPVDTIRSMNGGTVRDPFRTPMQWDSTINKAGFTDGTPYIPLGKAYGENNVATENAHRFDISYTGSQLSMVKDLLKLRQEESFLFGGLHIMNDNGVLIIVRKAEGFPGYMVAVNLESSSRSIRFSAGHGVEPPSLVQVAFHTGKLSSDEIIDVSDQLAKIPPKTAIAFKLV